VPEGTTPFPATAVLGESTPSVDPQTLVGQEVDSFTLGLSADGTVLAADASPAEAIGEQRLQASVAEGRELVPGSTTVEIGDGTVVDGRIEFPVTASAAQVRPLDAAALERTVLGLPIEQAKAALQPYGDVVIDPWPSWVTSVPSLEQRVILTVGLPVSEAASPGLTCPVRCAGVELAGGSRGHDGERLVGGSGAAGTIRRMSRILEIDLGERRIGLAVADPGSAAPDRCRRSAAPRRSTPTPRRWLASVASRTSQGWSSGCRSRPAGQEGVMAAGARAWATEIGTRLAIPVTMRDERLSSFEAERRLGRMPRGGRAARRRGPSATPIVRGSIGRPPPSSSRTSWTPARRLGEHPGGQGRGQPIEPQPQTPVRRADPYQRTGRYGRGPGDQRRYERYRDRRGGIGGILRFLLFLVAIAVFVLVVMATVARPLLRAVVVPWAWDNPSALQLGFVSDLVREDLGAALTDPASEDDTKVEFVVQPGDTPTSRRRGWRTPGSSPASVRSCTRRGRIDLLPKLNAGRYSLALNLTPTVVDGLVNNRIENQAQGHLPGGPAR
jgi:putative Holliday junction resolvase